jgi:hypothetical protein
MPTEVVVARRASPWPYPHCWFRCGVNQRVDRNTLAVHARHCWAGRLVLLSCCVCTERCSAMLSWKKNKRSTSVRKFMLRTSCVQDLWFVLDWNSSKRDFAREVLRGRHCETLLRTFWFRTEGEVWQILIALCLALGVSSISLQGQVLAKCALLLVLQRQTHFRFMRPRVVHTTGLLVSVSVFSCFLNIEVSDGCNQALETFLTSVNQQVAAIIGPTLVALCSPREHIFG